MSGAVVMDSGTWQLKVGRAGEPAPRALQRTLAARCKSDALRDAEGSGVVLGERVIEKGDILVPFSSDDPLTLFEKNWHSVIYARSHTLPESSPLCLVHSAFYDTLRPRFVETVFESLAAPSLFCLDAGAAGIMSRGKVTGLSLDIGEAAAVLMPVFEGLALTHEATISVPLGASEFRHQLRAACGVSSLSDFSLDTLRQDYFAHPRHPTFTALLPDRSPLTVQRSAVDEAVQHLTEELTKVLHLQSTHTDVALQGGGALLPGVTATFSSATAGSTALCHAAWLGGSLFACMEGVAGLFVSRAFYQEHGADQVIAKNFQ